MHILVTTDTAGGVWVYTQELVSGLLRRGDRVTLVSFGGLPRPDQTVWMQEFPNLDFRPTDYKLEWMQDSEGDIQSSKRLLKSIVNETQPDLLHLNQFCYGDLDIPIPRVVVAHSDVLSWWEQVEGGKPGESPWIVWYRETVKRGLAAADVVITPSGWMLGAIRKHYLDPAYGLVIYNGRTPSRFSTSTQKEDVVLSVGRMWDKAKQISLVSAIPDHVSVWIAGGTREPASESADNNLPHSPNCSFLGEQSQPELRDLFAQSAIYAATSRYEPFGLAPVEAAFSKCAIVANDIPVFRELWGSSVCYFQTNNGEDLASRVRVLTSDRELCRQYGEAAYQRASRLFTAERMVEEYRLLYRNVAATQVVA